MWVDGLHLPGKDLRAYPGTIRGTEKLGMIPIKSGLLSKEISTTSKTISVLQDAEPKIERTLHADLILAGITQLITVVLADKINHHEYIRSIKPLIA